MEMEEVRGVYDSLKLALKWVENKKSEEMGPKVTSDCYRRLLEVVENAVETLGDEFESEYDLFDDDEMPDIKVVSESFISDD